MNIHTCQPTGFSLKPVDTPEFISKTAFEDPLTANFTGVKHLDKEGYRPLTETAVDDPNQRSE